MSLISAAVSARLAAVRRSGDRSVLLAPEATADALALLRDAAPAPDREVSTTAVADVCLTFFLRAQDAEGTREQDFVLAAMLGGFVFEHAAHLLPRELRDRLASADDPLREARFAYAVASAHGEFAVPASGDGLAAGAMAGGDPAIRLAALDRAIAWSDRACAAFTRQTGATAFADALTQRMRLLAARFRLAGDLDALGAAARDGLAVTGCLSPRDPEHVTYLAPAVETVVGAACLLGTPPASEAERAAGLLEPGTATEATSQLLRWLHAVHAEPIDWPGEPDARAGLLLANEGRTTGHAGTCAAAARRLRAALSVTPEDHPARPQLAVALAAMAPDTGEEIDPSVIRDAGRFMARAGVFRLAAMRLDGPGFPPEAGLAAAILDVMIGLAAESGSLEAAVTDEWTASYDAWAARLPASYPGHELYAELPAALRDRDRGHAALAAVVEAVPWASAIAALRESAAGRDDAARQAALDFADTLEDALEQSQLRDLAALYRDMGALETSIDSLGMAGDDQGSARMDAGRRMMERVQAVAPDDAEAVTVLSGMLGALQAFGTLGESGDDTDPAVLQESLQAIVRASESLTGKVDTSPFADLFGLVLLTGFRADPLQMAVQFMRWDQESRRAALAMLASVPSRPAAGPEDDGGSAVPVVVGFVLAFAEFMLSTATLITESDVTQLDRVREIGQRLTDIARRSGNEVASVSLPAIFETVQIAIVGYLRTQEDIPRREGAETHGATVAALRRQLAGLGPDHPAYQGLEVQLALAIAGHAYFLRESDPAQAGELLAEARTLFRTEGMQEPMAVVARQLFEHLMSRAGRAESAPPPVPGPEPDKAELDPAEPGDAGPADWDGIKAKITAVLERVAGTLEELLENYEQELDRLGHAIDRGSDSRSAEHVIASQALIMPQAPIAMALQMLLQNKAMTDTLAGMDAVQQGRTAPDDFVPADAPVSVTGPRVDRAAALAERSRGLLITRQLEGRTDLSELRAAHPELASEFERLADRLSAVPDAAAAPGAADWLRLDKFRASQDQDALIERIRARDGFGGFLRALTPDQLRELAAHGPVVLIVYPDSQAVRETGFGIRPWAFVVARDAIIAVPLDVEPDAVTDAARRWRDAIKAVNARGEARPRPSVLRQVGVDLTEILSWTWHRVVAPVLDAAGLPRERAANDGWPRIWWIPDGPFHVLPLHAAQCRKPGCEEGGCGAGLDAVVSSYVPTFRMLAQARRHAAGLEAGTGRPLVVASTDDELPGAEAAAREAGRRLHARTALVGPAATRVAVVAALGEVTWAHFGCHATSDPAEPSGGILHLPSGEQLTVREICQARPLAARLAFLTACGTARTSERLAGEAIHLSSAFLIAGFGEAVGTLWEIESQDAYRVTAEFYRRVTGDRPEGAATALHHCVREVRRERPDAPHIWAAYVHAGA